MIGVATKGSRAEASTQGGEGRGGAGREVRWRGGSGGGCCESSARKRRQTEQQQ